MRRRLSLLLVSVSSFIAGCGAGFQDPADPLLGTQSVAIKGQAMGGQQPISNALVTVYEVGSSGYGAGAVNKATTSTDSNGNFSFPSSAYTCTASNTPMYITATGGNPGGGNNANVALIAALGPCSSAKTSFVVINEVTTAATVEALGQFMGTTLGTSGTANIVGGTCSSCATGVYNRGLVHAMNYTYPQLVTNSTGYAVDTHTTGVVTVKTEAAKLYTIANVIASCVNSQGLSNSADTTSNCGKLFTDTNATGSSTRPSDTLQAALQIARYPYYNVAATYALGSSTPPFGGGLSNSPNDWTVAIRYTSANFGLGIAQNTSSTLDIDQNGNIWIPSNKTGSAGLTVFNPSAITFSGPYATDHLVYPQYVALDQSSTPVAYATDLASKAVEGVNTASPLSTPSYFTITDGIYTTGGPLALDASNNILLAGGNGSSNALYTIKAARSALVRATDDYSDTFTPSATPNAVAVPLEVPFTNGYLYAGDTTTACNLEFSPGAQQGQGDRYSTGTGSCVVGGIVPAVYNNAYMTSSNNTICFYVPFQTQYNRCSTFASLNVPKAITLDGGSHFWVANAGNASVATFSVSQSNYTVSAIGSGYVHDANNGSTLTTPYGIGVDGSGNVWVSNASCVATSSTRCSPGNLELTEVIGVASPTITPLSYQEIGNSPASGNRPSN